MSVQTSTFIHRVTLYERKTHRTIQSMVLSGLKDSVVDYQRRATSPHVGVAHLGWTTHARRNHAGGPALFRNAREGLPGCLARINRRHWSKCRCDHISPDLVIARWNGGRSVAHEMDSSHGGWCYTRLQRLPWRWCEHWPARPSYCTAILRSRQPSLCGCRVVLLRLSQHRGVAPIF